MLVGESHLIFDCLFFFFPEKNLFLKVLVLAGSSDHFNSDSLVIGVEHSGRGTQVKATQTRRFKRSSASFFFSLSLSLSGCDPLRARDNANAVLCHGCLPKRNGAGGGDSHDTPPYQATLLDTQVCLRRLVLHWQVVYLTRQKISSPC